jgi:peptidoglycan/LPS O-acetylase OafA/YrhL
MQISISDAVFQTQIFIVVFVGSLLLSLKKRPALNFDNSLTEELKGFAMLAIVFSHIGYFLVSDHQFLFPISVAAGVGVNLFLLLSGYGLTISALEKPLSILEFYKRRLSRLYIPLWIVLVSLIAIDFLLLHITYPISYILQGFAGIYLTSNPSVDIDSPLWYFTLILFFYLIFPLIFRKSKPLLTGLAILILSWVLLQLPLPLHADNINLYKLHFLSFPLGIMLASIKDKWRWHIPKLVQFGFLVLTFGAFCYFAYYSGVGQGAFKEQAISVLSVFLILSAFILKNFKFQILNLVGKYSYEIYLLHWPIMFRFENLFGVFPAAIAVIIYLIEFIILGYLLQNLTKLILSKKYKLPKWRLLLQ